MAGLGNAESFALGAGLNARGALEIIIATVGLSLGVLSSSSYTAVVIMAIVTSMTAPPLLRAVARRWRGTEEEQRRLWLVVGLVYTFPDWWETVLYSVTSAITLVMVFVIQHTQTRQQSATQRKLDELLRAMPTADDRLIAVEEAPDQELGALAELNLADRERSTTAS